MRKGVFDASPSSPNSNDSPSDSKGSANMFSSFAYKPPHAAKKRQHNQNTANDSEGPDNDGWMEVKRPNDKAAQWEKRKDEIKAVQKERNKQHYKEMKEQMKIRKRAKDEEEADEDDNDNSFIFETVKKPPVDLTRVTGKSSLIKNSLLNKDTDTYDPLDELRSKNKTPRTSVYDRISQSNYSPNSLSNTPTPTGNSKHKPFKSPSPFIPPGYKSKVSGDSFVVENVSKKASQVMAAAPAAKQRRIVLSDDDEDDDSGNQTHPSTSSRATGAVAHVYDMTLDDSGEDQVVMKKSSKQLKKNKKASKPAAAAAAEKKSKKRRVVESEDEAESLPSESDSDDGRDNSDGSASDEGNEEVTTNQLQDRVNNILRQCESVSKKLHSKLSEWESDRSTQANRERDCINLIKIDDRVAHGGSSLVTDDALQAIHPALKLNGYQLVGVNWINLLYQNAVNGVLADDMGLGKTVQTIAFLSWLTFTAQQAEQAGPPHLVVVPASTLSNWANEINKFNPNLRVFTYHGTQAERANLRYQLKSQIHTAEVDVVLCTYTLFERENNKHDRAFLWNLQFDYLVLDEAHCIKNPEAFRYTHLNAINSQHRLLLSGTPVQNNVNELLALLSFLMPKVFKYDKCIAMMDALGWTDLKKNQSSSLHQLKHMLAPFVLRRLKVDVLDQLSTKETVVRKLDMTERQQTIYTNILSTYAEQRKIKQLIYAQQAVGEVNLDNVVASSRGANTSSSSAKGSGSLSAIEIDLTTPESSSVAAAPKEHVDKFLGASKTHQHNAVSTPIDLTALSSPVSRDNVMEVSARDDDIVVALPAFSPQVSDVVIVENKEDSQSMNLTNTLTATEAKSLFTDLRKAANHPLLLRIYYNDQKVIQDIAKVAHAHEHFGTQCDVQRVIEEIQTYSDFDLHQICVQYPHYLRKYELAADVLYDSPKMVFLRDNLPKLQADGHRMLVFSQWTRILDLLEVLLDDMSLPYLRLDGSTAVKERQELIDTFNTDTSIPVFLLSTKAGGLGINLTSADTVILHDLDFNPENDKQAEDRCHRIGQTKPVAVYKLVAAGTVDEDIFELGEKKSQLSRAVLSTNKQADETGDIALISRILSKALMKHMSGGK